MAQLTSLSPASFNHPRFRRAWVFFLFVAALTAALGWFAVRDLQEIVRRGERLIADDAHDVIAAEQLRTLSERRAREVREYLLTGSPQLLGRTRDTNTVFERRVGELHGHIADPQGRLILQSVREANAVNLAAVERSFARRSKGEAQERLAPGFETEIQPSRVVLDAALAAFVAHEQAEFESNRDLVTREENRAIVFIGIVVALAFGSSIVAGTYAQSASARAHDAVLARERAEREIVQRRETETALQARTVELERSNNDLEQFAYVASHDLQEPLRMVGSYTQLLARRYRGRLDSDADEFIAFAVDGVTRMQRLINELLAYSRVVTRGRALASIDSGAALEAALLNLRAAIEESGVTITREAMPRVMADEIQLTQIFQNLIGNALKFRGTAPPVVHVSAHPDGNDAIFGVRDNGIGIEPQYFDRIFMIFQRLHPKDAHAGTGLGLAICRKIVERHGGRIWVESEPARGSVFWFSLPAV